MLVKVISGGQRGADQAGWRAAKAVGIRCSGWMPLGFRTEGALLPSGRPGPDEFHPEYADLYGAREHTSSRYEDRTPLNVNDADVTLIIGDLHSYGSRLAWNCFRRKIGDRGRDPGIYTIREGWIPIHRWPTSGALNLKPEETAGILAKIPHRVINVAGNRESKSPGIGAWVERYLLEVFRLLLTPP